jgi:hypothetical protein
MKVFILIFSAMLSLGCKAEQAINKPGSIRPGEAHEHISPSKGRGTKKGLTLFLSTTKKELSASEPVEVVLSIENHDETYWAFFPVFAPEGQSPEDHPLAELSFLVVHESGDRIPWSGQYESLREPPPLCSAEILMPLAFCGSHIDLTEGKFSYALRKPGLYKIKARLRLYQTPWVKNRLQLLKVDPAELPYDLRRIFDGVLESNEVEIKLQAQ